MSYKFCGFNNGTGRIIYIVNGSIIGMIDVTKIHLLARKRFLGPTKDLYEMDHILDSAIASLFIRLRKKLAYTYN